MLMNLALIPKAQMLTRVILRSHKSHNGGTRLRKKDRSPSKTVVPNLGPPDVLGLQALEILASRGGGEGFWEL